MTMHRPETMHEIIGLKKVKAALAYAIQGARTRGKNPPHYLISGAPGLGKTTIASILAASTQGQIHHLLGSELRTENDVYNLANNVKDGDIIFVDEAHGIGSRATMILLPWMEDYKMYSQAAPKVVPKPVFLFPTTNAGMLSPALRSRCKTIHLDFYSDDEIMQIMEQALQKKSEEFEELMKSSSAEMMDNPIKMDKIDREALAILAKSSRGTPRIALEQRLEPLLDIMSVDQTDLDLKTVNKFLAVHQVHPLGLESQDTKYCEVLAQQMTSNNYNPVSSRAMIQMTGLSADVITDVVESFLNKNGLIAIYPRGRVLTTKGWKELGLDVKYNADPARIGSVVSINENDDKPLSEQDQKIIDTVASMQLKATPRHLEQRPAGKVTAAVANTPLLISPDPSPTTPTTEIIADTISSAKVETATAPAVILNMTMNTPESSPTPIAPISAIINWVEIEEHLNSGKFKLQNYATEKGLSASELRTAFLARYGSKVKGMRGRGGGFVWNTTASN